MKTWMKLLLAVLIVAAVGCAGYLAWDYFTAEQDQGDLRDLAAQVAEVEQQQQKVDQGPLKPVGAAVELVSATLQGASDEVQLDANGIPLPKPERTGQPEGFDGAALAEVIRAEILQDGAFVNPAIEGLQLQISPPLGDKAPAVSALAVGEFLKSSPNLAGLERQISAWLKMQGYREQTIQNVELRVQVEMPMLEQYAGLYAQNKDLIGWIKIEGTQINYPVMQTPEDPEFYLRANFEGKYAYCGLPFLDARNDPYDPDQNLIVYAHNMKNGTMFGTLQLYKDPEYWKAHKRVRFDLLFEAREYEVFGMFESRQYEDGEEGFQYYEDEYIDLSDKEAYEAYVRGVKDSSIIDTGITPQWGEQLLTMSTCSYHTEKGTFVVVARRVG